MTLPLLYESQGPIAVITLNRPERHNAMSPEVVCRLADAFDAFEANKSLRVAVLTGSGEGSFCSGGDLELTLPLLSGARQPETEWDHRLAANRDALFRSALKGPALTKPIIAAINGHCLAGGFELMLATDIRIAAEHARFGLPEARHALIPFAGALARLPRQLPPAIALELMMTGDQTDAATLLGHGLLNRVLPGPGVLPAAMDMARRIAANGPVSVSEIKRAVYQSVGRPLEDGYRIETESMDRVMATEDAREGPRAFMQRRRPVFTGR